MYQWQDSGITKPVRHPEREIVNEVKMKRTHLLLALNLLITYATVAGETMELSLNATAVSESGAHLARGTLRVTKTEALLKCALPSTRGQSNEPVAMYMLISYVVAPTPELLRFPPVEGETWTQEGDWNANAETTIDGHETVEVPAGTFPRSLKHKTIITNTQADSEAGSTFVNGTRYLWFARGVGLVRMRYKHSNGLTTEAVLLSYKVSSVSDDYLPLEPGNRWTYGWKNEYRNEAVIETCLVGKQPHDIRRAPLSRREAPDREPEVRGVDSDTVKLDISEDAILKIAPNPENGFNFPYYLFIPQSIDPEGGEHMLVEMNNTGTASDDFELHDRKARQLVERAYANQIARKLNVPLLVPVFPRPREQWRIYTHSLDEDTLLVESGQLKRIDLQLIQMIRDAQALLRRNNINVQNKVFMHGFSASGTFTNRFAILHPQVLRAVAAGGVNAIPTFPAAQWRGEELPYPIGIKDLKEIADIDFDETAYKQVSQYVYMGYFDRNDTTLSRDTYCEEHAKLIRTLIGAEMPRRWEVSKSIYEELQVPAQLITYNGTAHTVRSEMIDDIVDFFRANSGDSFVKIEPHEYPFVEFKEITVAHIKGLYWRGDERIPEWTRDLFSGKGHFIITIEEWTEGQDHRQLNTFRKKVVFEFVLRADGHEDIVINKTNFKGTSSSGKGDFQGFVVGLADSQLEKMVRGVEYTITPISQIEEYSWKVREEVRLVRP